MSIDLLQRALDYVRFYNPEKDQEIRAKLFEDLQAAIAKHEQIHTSADSNTHQCKQEPVAYIGTNQELFWLMSDGTRRPLYTHPSEVTCSTGLCHYRKPLTDEMRNQMKDRCDSMKMRGAFADGWLSAEAAHGIGKNK